MIQIGDFDIHSVRTGSLWLDGGAMFGVVPKVLWCKSSDVDEQNRIPLATRSIVARNRVDGRIVIADTGCGSKWSPKEAEKYRVQFDPGAISKQLHIWGADENAVTDVVVTHLHFDHNGGLTDWYDDPGGKTVLRFPRARHWIHRRHWEHAQQPHAKDRASFLSEDFAALEQAGVLHFVDGDRPTCDIPGMEWFISHGHTPYHLHPVLASGDAKLIFVGDLIPTSAHLRLAWVMAYDMQPRTTIDEKDSLLSNAIREGHVLAFAHDPKHQAVRIDGEANRPIISEVVDLT